MSRIRVEYFELADPVTRLYLKESEGRHRVTIWGDNLLVGWALLPPERSGDFLRLFADIEAGPAMTIDEVCRKDRHSVRDVVHWSVHDIDHLPDETQLLSDSGKLVTAGQIRALHGATAEEAGEVIT